MKCNIITTYVRIYDYHSSLMVRVIGLTPAVMLKIMFVSYFNHIYYVLVEVVLRASKNTSLLVVSYALAINYPLLIDKLSANS